jgi:hypothetical protein
MDGNDQVIEPGLPVPVNEAAGVEDSQQEQPIVSEGDVELVRGYLDLQKKELQIKEVELGLREKALEHSHSYAIKSLEANERDRKEQRKFFTNIVKHSTWIGVAVIIIFAALVSYILYLNKEQILIDIIKYVFIAGGSGTGGYYIGKNRKTEKNDEKNICDVHDV